MSGTRLQVTHEQHVARCVEVVGDAARVGGADGGAGLGALIAVPVDGLRQMLHQLVHALRQHKVRRDGDDNLLRVDRRLWAQQKRSGLAHHQPIFRLLTGRERTSL